MAEDVIARYVLDLNTLKGQVQELERLYGKTGTAAEKASSTAKKAFGSIGDSVASIGAGIVAAFSIQQIIAFGKEAINEFSKAEDASNKLAFSIKKIGGEGDAAFKELITQAEKLSNISIFDKTDILNAQALQAQFGLTSDEIKKLTPQILDLASVTGQDLASATNIAIDAIRGRMSPELKRAGIQFQDTGKELSNFNELTKQLEKIQGATAEAVNSTSGSLKNQEKEISNLKEQIGEKLAPVFVKLKLAVVDAAKNIVDFFITVDSVTKRKQDISNVADFILADTLVTAEQLKGTYNEVALNIAATAEKIRKIKESSKTEKLSFGDAKEVANLNLYLQKQVNYRDAIAEAIERIKAKEKKASDDAIRNSKIEILQKENLLSLSKDQLQAEIDILNSRSDKNSPEIKDEISRRQDRIDKIKEIEAKAEEDAIKLRADALQKLKDLDDKANQQSLEGLAESEAKKLEIQRDAKLKLINDTARQAGGGKDVEAIRLSAVVATNKFYNKQIKDANQKAADDLFKILQDEVDKENDLKEKNQAIDLSRIDRDTQREIIALKTKYNELGDFSEDAEKKLQDRILNAEIDGINKKLLAVQKGSDKELELKNELQDKLNQLGGGQDQPNKLKAFFDKKEVQEAIDLSQQLVGTLNELYQQAANEQIAQIERVKEAEIKALDDQLSANQRNLDDRKIGAREFRQTEDRLIKQKQAAEETARKKEIEIKRKQDIANRAQKLFEITIATARAIAEVSPNPYLIALAAVLGAAQTAVVLGTPLPQYAKGTKYVDKESRFAPGIDTVPAMLTRGERVITAKDNKEHWELYEAVSNKRLNDYVLKKYVTPALLKAQSTAKITDQRTFAENVAYSLSLNEKSLASEIASAINKDNEWRTRRGQKVIGMDDLIETIKSTSKPQYRRN
jgi:hypothetical protein